MAYDAMSAIAQALAQDPTRKGIQNTLSSNNFSALDFSEQRLF